MLRYNKCSTEPMRALFKLVAAVVALYLILLGAIFAAMLQPPARFGKIISKMPGLLMRIIPFPPMWAKARAGALQVGDAAPEFDLETIDRKSRVKLSSFRGQKPVVLVFGSYT